MHGLTQREKVHVYLMLIVI